MASSGSPEEKDVKKFLLGLPKAKASPGAAPGGAGSGASIVSPRSALKPKAAPTAVELLQRAGLAAGSFDPAAQPSPLSPSPGAGSSRWGGGSAAAPSARSSVLQFRGLGGLGTSYFLEKQAVVIDFGRAYTKVGFATESRPRHTFPSSQLRAWRRRGPSLSTSVSEEEWMDILDRLFSKVFFYYLNVSPKDRRVVICDAAQSPVQFRCAVANVLFKRFGVPAVSFAAGLVLPLYLTGLSSGIVIDCGYEATRVMATFAGVPILSALSSASCGSRRVQRRLGRSLRKRLPTPAATPAEAAGTAATAAVEGGAGSSRSWMEEAAVLEDIAVRAGYVACTIPAANPGEPALTLKSDKAMPFTPPGREPLLVPPECRWEPFEVFFGGEGGIDGETTEEEDDVEESCSCYSIPEAFAQTVSRCPMDVRAAALQNVVVCGGCAGLRGLLPRLALELRSALMREPALAPLAERLRITPLDFAPVSAVWAGGSVFGALEGVGDYTREDYERGKALPDWARDGYV